MLLKGGHNNEATVGEASKDGEKKWPERQQFWQSTPCDITKGSMFWK